eukprot:357832-Chlamydomonas_euryale.AAC.11
MATSPVREAAACVAATPGRQPAPAARASVLAAASGIDESMAVEAKAGAAGGGAPSAPVLCSCRWLLTMLDTKCVTTEKSSRMKPTSGLLRCSTRSSTSVSSGRHAAATARPPLCHNRAAAADGDNVASRASAAAPEAGPLGGAMGKSSPWSACSVYSSLAG